MQARRVLTGAGLIALAFVVGSAAADDIRPPYWAGQVATSLASWESLTTDPTPLLEKLRDPVNSALVLAGAISSDVVWQHEGAGYRGASSFAAGFDVRAEQPRHRNVWVQLAWMVDQTAARPMAGNAGPSVKTTAASESILAPTNPEAPFGDAWFHQPRVEPAPAQELVRAHGNIMGGGLVNAGSVMLVRGR